MSAPENRRLSRHGGHGSIEDDEAENSAGCTSRETDFCDRVCQRGVKCALGDYCTPRLNFRGARRGRVACGAVTEDGSREDDDEAGGKETGSRRIRRQGRGTRGRHGEDQKETGTRDRGVSSSLYKNLRKLSSVQVTPEYRPQGRGYVTCRNIEGGKKFLE